MRPLQAYIAFPGAGLNGEPAKHLKGFEKVYLEPGESRTVAFTFDDAALSRWDAESHSWEVSPGPFEYFIGTSSRDISVRGTL